MNKIRPKGLYRIINPAPMEHDAYISDGGISMPIPRSRYEMREYKPPFEDLPTKEEYEAKSKET